MSTLSPKLKLISRTAALAVAISLLAGCGGAEERKTKYYDRGIALFEEGNYEKARLEFKNVLQIDPKDLEARFMLGQTLGEEQEYRAAASQYLAVLGEDSEHPGALAKLGTIYLLTRDVAKTREHGEKLLAQDPESVPGMVLMAGAAALEGNTDEAADKLKIVLERAPGNVEATALLASVYNSQGQVDEAIAQLKTSIEQNPKESDLRVILAQTLLNDRQTDAAIEVVEGLIAANPDILSHRMRLVTLYTASDRIDDAIGVLEQAVADLSDQQEPKLAHIKYVAQRKGLAEAEALLKKYIAQGDERFELRFALGQLYEQQENLDAADALYDEVQAEVDDAEAPPHLRAAVRKALLAIRRADVDAAMGYVNEVLEVNPRDNQALILRGSMQADQGDALAAIADFRAALRDDANNARVLELLANAHMRNGEPELARDNMRKAVDSAPENVELRRRAARMMLEAKQIDEATELLGAVLDTKPGDENALQTLFKIHVFNKDVDAAREVAARYREAHPDSAQGFYWEGLIAQSDGDVEGAISSFSSALTVEPQAIQPLSELVKVLLANDRMDEAVARLEETIELTDTHFVAHNLLGEIYLREKHYADARKAFETASSQQPTWAIPYRNLASVEVSQDNLEAARAVLEEGVEQTNGQAILVTTLAGILEQLGELDVAIERYENSLSQQPDNLLVANNLAMLLVEYREDTASLDRAAALADKLRGSSQPAFIDTIGWVAYRRGEYKEAVDQIEQAMEASPDSPLLHYHLGMAYFKLGNAVLAKDNLMRALEGDKPFRGREEAEQALNSLTAEG